MVIHSKCSFIIYSRLSMGVLSYKLNTHRRKMKLLSLLFIEEQVKSKRVKSDTCRTGAAALASSSGWAEASECQLALLLY